MLTRRTETGGPTGRPWDELFTALAAEPRRQLLVSLGAVPNGHWVTLPDAAMNPRIALDADALRLALCHRHLPLLAEYDYVVWERDPLRARAGARFEAVLQLIEALQDSSGPLHGDPSVGYPDTSEGWMDDSRQ